MVDQIRLVIVINDDNALGQRPIDLHDFFLNALDHLLDVFVDPFQHDPGYDLALAVLRHRPLAELVADLDSGHVADPDRRSPARIEHDVLDVLDIFDQTKPAHHILLVAVFDEVGAGVLIVVLDRVEERFQRDVVVNQRLLVH